MRARLWRHDMQLHAPVSAAAQVHTARPHLFLEVEIDGVRGLGEISPQPEALNGDPGLEDVVVELEHFTLRQFVEASEREGGSPNWARVTHFAGSRRASYPASALLELALLDAHLRSQRLRIDEHWPARFETPLLATVSLLDDGEWDVPDDAVQVRAKISPLDVPALRWERLAKLSRPILLDFNCSAASVEDAARVVALAQSYVDVCAVEQPFAAGNVVEHAHLAAVLDVPLSIDEGIRHRRDLDQITRYQAAQLVCIKPARVGGYAQARTMIERANDLGLGVYLGGFFESPLARGANRALARHLITRPSDIAVVGLANHEGALSADPWGCGYLPDRGLESTEPLITLRW